MYARYYSEGTGFEKTADSNIEDSKNPLALFDHALFIMLLSANGTSIYYPIRKLMYDMKIEFYGGQVSKQGMELLSRNSNTYSILSVLCVLEFSSTRGFGYLRRIATKTAFKFGRTIPMHLGYWGLFFPSTDKYKLFCKIMTPLLVLKLITATSARDQLLHLLVLRSFKKTKNYEKVYSWFKNRLTKKYGDNFIDILTSAVYTDKNHPNRVYSAGLTYKDL